MRCSAKKGLKYLLLAFLFPCTVMLLILAAHGVYPFGNGSFLHMDMYHQYMPFFTEMYHKLRLGESFLYSWNIGLGSNFLSLFAYYLASPVNWLMVLVPEKHLMEFMTYMVLIKMSLCGVTFYAYLRGHYKKDTYSMVLFSCFYALSGFMTAYSWNVMWLDNILLTPLILLGLEKLYYEKKFLLYTVTLGCSILTDYYLSIMICIFVVCFLLVQVILKPDYYRRLGLFAGSSLLAGGLAGVLLVPAYMSLRGSDFGNIQFPETITSYFSVLEVFSRHFMNVVTEQKLDHWPNVYCGVAVLILLPLFGMNSGISLRERIAKLGLTGFMLLGFTVNGLVWVWHGFNYPDSLPARQSFLYIFLILILCYEAWEHRESLRPSQLGISVTGALLFVALCEKLVGYEEDHSLAAYLLTALFVAAYGVLFYLLIFRKRQKESYRERAIFLGLATCLVLAEAGINMEQTSVSVVSRSSYLEKIEICEKLADRIRLEDPGFYRLEKEERITKNDGALGGYPTATVFSSAINSRVGDFYESIGMGHSKVFYCYDGATPLTSALLNVKYLFSDSGKEEGGGLYTLVDQEGDTYLYECLAVLPLGFLVPEGFQMPAKTSGESWSPLEVQNTMVRKLLDGERLFIEVGSRELTDGVQADIGKAGYYFAVPRIKKIKNVTLSVNQMTREFHNMGNGYVIPLGYAEPEDQLVLTCEETKDPAFGIYRMDAEKLLQAVQKLGEQPFLVEQWDSHSLRGSITVQTPGELMLTIPYEKGWSMWVDGVKTEPEAYGDTFLGVFLEEGTHEIRLSYFPEGFQAGILLSLCSVLLLTGICILQKRSNEKKKTGQTNSEAS